ncbi:MAG: choice-of-anchor Q domain-containing protein [Bacteroidota bacterium]
MKRTFDWMQAFCLLFFIIFSPDNYLGSLNAATITVNSNANAGAGSLRQAVLDAQSGDSIDFVITGQIVLDSQIVINKNLFIQGPGAPDLAISGGKMTRLFQITDGDTVSIGGLSLRDGNVYNLLFPAGGAIVNRGFLTLSQCYIHDNEAGYGGAIISGFQGLDTKLELYDCSFAFNTALDAAGNPSGIPEAGGAIYIDGTLNGSADVDAWNCTFANNRADSTGGAVFLTGDNLLPQQTSFEANNCTFVNNEAELVAGIAYNRSPVVRTRNSLYANNIGATPNMEGSIQSFGYNLIDNSGGIFFVPNGTADPNDLLDIEANVGVLGENQGPVPTVPISCTSPAIDAGDTNNAPTEDARGKARNGAADIGAYEFIPNDITIFNLASNGPGSLPQAVLLACPGDTLRLNGLTGNLHLDQTLVLDKDLSILGNPLNDIFLRGGDSIRLMQIDTAVNAYLRWLNFYDANPSNYGGGAIQNNGVLRVEQSTFARNQARSGGAIANYGLSDTAKLTAINCTFSANEALFLDGGAIDNRNISAPATLNLTHCTFTQNKAFSKGGALYNDANNQAESVNSIYSGNSASEGPEIYGSLTSLGHNLIANDLDLALQSDNDLINVNVALNPLGQYGGPTTTHSFNIQAVVIDQAKPLAGINTDQRGEARVFNGTPDIGAYEFNPTTSVQPLLDQGFKLYPNPNKGHFVVAWEGDVPRGAVILIRNQAGQTVLKSNLEDAQTQIELPPNVAKGLYFLQIVSDTQQLSQTFIVQ